MEKTDFFSPPLIKLLKLLFKQGCKKKKNPVNSFMFILMLLRCCNIYKADEFLLSHFPLLTKEIFFSHRSVSKFDFKT